MAMKINKKKLFAIHSWVGIKVSILFFVVCFSGTLATLSNEIDWLFMPDIRAVSKEETASVNAMVKNVREAYPGGEFIYMMAAEAPYLCHQAYVQQDGKLWYVFVNPYTAEVQGASTMTFYRFFRDLHYYLFIPFGFGHYTVLIFGFLLLISLLTAITFYKSWYRKLFELKRGSGKLVFYRSLHRLVGVWSVPFMILFSITGIWYFLERTNTGGISRIANGSTPEIELASTDTAYINRIAFVTDYDRALEHAQQEIPGLQVKDFSPPTEKTPIYFTGKSEVPLVRNRANRVYVHPETYQVLKVQKAEALNTTTYLNDIADPLHFGDWGGLTTKVIWFIFGLAISGLILTGIWIGLKRRVRDKRKQKAQRMGAWKYINWVALLIIISFLFGQLVVRYHAPAHIMITIGVAVLLMLFAGWYLFSYKIRRSLERENLR